MWRKRGRLLREADLTLDKAIDVCRASEITSSQAKVFNEEVEVHEIKTVKNANKDGGNNGYKTKPAPRDEQKERKVSEKKTLCKDVQITGPS